MAARRNKSQARRNTGGGAAGLPGWAWLVMGILATLVLLAALVVAGVVSAPKFVPGNPDGFFRPQPNPDAEPAPVDADGEAIVPDGAADSGEQSRPRAGAGGSGRKAAGDDPDYDFYTLLPGKEVPMSEAEIAATAQAETRRAEQAQARVAQTAATAATPTLPAPVRDEAAAAGAGPTPPPATRPSITPPAATGATAGTAAPSSATPSPVAAAKPATPPAPIGTDTRYLLQAGAFQASGQAEELKAKIAMLGLGARVESAQIKGKTVYRVRMGPYGTASDLSEAKRKLASSGVPGMAIKVD